MTNTQEEMPECPLCMEAFEVDDLSFFPCTCGYQICRFCWHRIRTNESGLCPACRKPYPEDPAQFKPLTDDEVHNIKRDRRQKESQRKQKSAENRKHLANVRVVQKNLVFVVGLSQRLADAEVLKRHEYFGKFGKIHKVVINQSTSYIGSQGPSASAYVTYLRPEDALHAILVVNNLQVDNRTLKASLGTTKYCSHFLKGTQCTKTDCMYLHDLGDEAASFSKEDIQQGKHLQYEQKLIEQYTQNLPSSETIRISNSKSKSPSPSSGDQISPSRLTTLFSPDITSLSLIHKSSSCSEVVDSTTTTNNKNMHVHNGLLDNIDYVDCNHSHVADNVHLLDTTTTTTTTSYTPTTTYITTNSTTNNNTAGDVYAGTNENTTTMLEKEASNNEAASILDDDANSLNIDSSSHVESILTNGEQVDDNNDDDDDDDNDALEDDLGFDPWDICSKGLADMMEKEKMLQKMNVFNRIHMPLNSKINSNTTHAAPNNYNHHNASLFNSFQTTTTQQLSYLSQQQSSWNVMNQKHLYQADLTPRHNSNKLIDFMPTNKPFNNEEPLIHNDLGGWQDNLKALLPNINISFSPSSTSANNTSQQLQQQQQQLRRNHTYNSGVSIQPTQNGFHSYHNSIHSHDNSDWLNNGNNTIQSITSDPAIISTGIITDGVSLPRWMDQFNDLTDASCHIQHHNHHQYHQHNNHHHGYGVHNDHLSNSWMQQHSSRYPPPGFSSTKQHNDAASEHRLPAI